MAKRILVLAGSPRRHGNTNTVTQWFVDAAKAAGAEVEVVDTTALKYATTGCTECMGCQMSEKFICVVKDEAAEVIARIPTFDVLMFSTPVFWHGPSAQLKMLLDRTFALIKFDNKTEDYRVAFEKKTLGLIATSGGDQDSGLRLVEDSFRLGATFMHCRFESLLVPFAPHHPAEIADREDIKRAATDLGKKLAK